MEDGGLGDEDCRHSILIRAAFLPGVVSYLCACGLLIGFEVLEGAERPAEIVEILAARFRRLPKTVYYGTACQASRNYTRLMPLLVRLSKTSLGLDRLHAPPHEYSTIFDANNYPKRSGLHKNSAAENRHSLNNPLQSHPTYLAQDRLVVQMRLIGAVNNLLILYRRFRGVTDVRHHPLPSCFQSRMMSHCEPLGCECRVAQYNCLPHVSTSTWMTRNGCESRVHDQEHQRSAWQVPHYNWDQSDEEDNQRVEIRGSGHWRRATRKDRSSRVLETLWCRSHRARLRVCRSQERQPGTQCSDATEIQGYHTVLVPQEPPSVQGKGVRGPTQQIQLGGGAQHAAVATDGRSTGGATRLKM